MSRRLSRLVATLLLLCSTAALAQSAVPVSKQAVLLLRTLAYDRKLRSRTRSAVRVLVLYSASNGRSRSDAQELFEALQQLAESSVVIGKSILPELAEYQGRDDLAARLGEHRYAAVYLCPGLEGAAADIAQTAGANTALTFSGDDALVRSGQVGVGFVPRDGRAALVIGLSAVKAQGADLDPSLLQLAELVRPATPERLDSGFSPRATGQ